MADIGITVFIEEHFVEIVLILQWIIYYVGFDFFIN